MKWMDSWLSIISIVLLLSCVRQCRSGHWVQPAYDVTKLAPRSQGNRTAILLTGQLRSGNLTWMSGHIRSDKSSRLFGSDDPDTPIKTILENLIVPMALEGGVDMFIYIQVDPQRNASGNATEWDGDPFTYEESLGDTRMCELYSKHPIFHYSTGNKVFCFTELEKEVSNSFIWANPAWEGQLAREILLQQLYGMFMANSAAKQYSLASGVNYRYKMRLRPDLAIGKPVQPLSTIKFRNQSEKCPGSTVYYPNNVFFSQGAEDSFNIGEAEAMDNLLDRYIDITTKPFIYRSWRGHRYWASESYLQALMEERYHTCLDSLYELWIVVIRKEGHQTHYNKPSITSGNEWKLMNPTPADAVK